MQNTQKEPTFEERLAGLRNAVQIERNQIANIGPSIDGIKAQVRMNLEDLNQIENGYAQLIQAMKADFDRELNALKKDFEDYKREKEGKNDKPKKEPVHSMDDPKKK